MAGFNYNGFNAATHASAFVDPRSSSKSSRARESRLPWNLIAHVTSFLDDDVQTLSRLCCASRIMYYMTLPQLWKNVILTSHVDIRYKDQLPEGFGSASPFSMGLNALVTRNISNLVKSLTLDGGWRALDLEQYSRVGRVSESAMILNIAVRAALDRCVMLEKFSWDLDTRLLPNVYGGLSTLEHLTSLHLRFPSTRAPQPTTEVPVLPNLQTFVMTHYDPLCYPDDISRLLLQATKLHTLHMHFSTRMREVGEPSLQLTHFFRRNIAAKRKLKIRSLGLYNCLARAVDEELAGAFDIEAVAEFTSLNTFGRDETYGGNEGASARFFDASWNARPRITLPTPKSWRIDQLSRFHADVIQKDSGIERLYLVNARWKPKSANVTPPSDLPASISNISTSESSPVSSHTVQTPGTTPSLNDSEASTTITPTLSAASAQLRDLYLDNICSHNGDQLKHLIFPARWPLSNALMAKLIRACPNLTQLSCSMECTDIAVLRMLVPFLKKLWAVRLVAPDYLGEGMSKVKSSCDYLIEQGDETMKRTLANALAGGSSDGGEGDFPCLRYVGLGDKIWKVGGVFQTTTDKDGREDCNEEQQNTGKAVFRRRISRIATSEVERVEIWGMDSLNVVVPE